MKIYLYNILIVIITAVLGLLCDGFYRKMRFHLSKISCVMVDCALTIFFFSCCLFLIEALLPQEQGWYSLQAFIYSVVIILLDGVIFLLVCWVRKHWQYDTKEIGKMFLRYLRLFLFLYIMFWHIIPTLLSFWITLDFFEIKHSDLILLLILCGFALLMEMFVFYQYIQEPLSHHQYLNEEESKQYDRIIDPMYHNKNRL